MNKSYILYSFALIAVVFCSCTKNNEPNYAELLKGAWANTMVNEQAIMTDNTFIMEFKSDNIQLYAVGYRLDDNNKGWRENNNYTYSINQNLISIDGTDGLEDNYHLVLNILSLEQDLLSYSVQTFSLNGEVIADTKTYTCQKITKDYSEEFTGVWYGLCTTEGSADSLYHYWEYFDDGSYNYYYQDENSNWIKKTDNEGQYFLYGNLMVSNYSHDLLSGGTGLAYECWNFSINRIQWCGPIARKQYHHYL